MSLPTLTPTPTGSKISAVIAHMTDCWPEDAAKLNDYLARPDLYAHQDIADVLTTYCRDNNLGSGVSEASVRRWRKANA